MSYIKSIINCVLGAAGLELRRQVIEREAPRTYDEPLEAISSCNSGVLAAINCDLEKCVVFNGFSFGARGWHPFVEASKEYLRTGRKQYAGSALENYYLTWQPRNGLEALIGASQGPSELKRFPAHIMHAPWFNMTFAERLAGIERIIESENRSHGGVDIPPAEGHGFQGPISARKAELEYRRLISVVDSIRRGGYSRAGGDVEVQVLCRGNEYRFRLVHGHHRVAALAALGYSKVPAVPKQIVFSEEASHWPQVYREAWSQAEALAYFDHHFDFDPRAWAAEQDLILG